jgi:hypothetical protein
MTELEIFCLKDCGWGASRKYQCGDDLSQDEKSREACFDREIHENTPIFTELLHIIASAVHFYEIYCKVVNSDDHITANFRLIQ